MKHKLVVNGKEHEIEILHGAKVRHCYDGIVHMAGESLSENPSVVWKCSGTCGILAPMGEIDFHVNDKPSFDVVVAGNG